MVGGSSGLPARKGTHLGAASEAPVHGQGSPEPPASADTLQAEC